MDTAQINKNRTDGIHRRTIGLITLIGIVVVLLIFSSYRLGSRMIEQYMPLIDAVMELQLQVTTSHLGFEEIIGGDTHETKASVYSHLDMADRYAELMLSGGVYESVTYMPLQDESMRAHVLEVRNKLAEYRSIMDKRWELLESNLQGATVDETLDDVFRELITQASSLEAHFHEETQVAMQRFFLNNLLLFAFALTITAAVGMMVRRFVLRQAYGVHLLERTNLELASEVEKRKRTETLLEKQARTDHLTGIVNRSRMSEILEEEWSRVARYPEQFSLIMFDIDHFKRVNDKLGHHSGDRALVELTHRVKRELRDIDVFARWGGEEFLILLPQTGLHGAEEVAERCRKAFVETPIADIGTITGRFGVVEYSSEDDTLQHLLQRADSALYEAKRHGRDRVSSESESH